MSISRVVQILECPAGQHLAPFPRPLESRRVRKYERSLKARILEAFSKFAETSRRGTGSVIGAPEQTSLSSSHCQPSLDTSHPKRPRHAGLEFVCGFGHDARGTRSSRVLTDVVARRISAPFR